MDTPNIPGTLATVGSRRNEDIALDLFKFIADRTDMGKAGSGVGFQTADTAKAQQDRADKMLDLYGRCLNAVQGVRR
jgi:hypothetical protein